MFAAEQLFNSLSYEDLYCVLRAVIDEDCYLQDYLVDEISEDFLYMLDVYDITFVASDDRILLTPKGERVLQYISKIVELEKKQTKIKQRKKL